MNSLILGISIVPENILQSGHQFAPNINTGCVIKITENGEVLESLWDLKARNHPMVTSMKEHKGHLYLGGIQNNRIGKYKIPDANKNWSGFQDYWGGK